MQIRARLKADEDGRFTLNFGLSTGDAFTSGWNATGVGTGEGSANIHLKHLFVAAKPFDGVEVEHGSLPPQRGESSEITSYDKVGSVTLEAGYASVDPVFGELNGDPYRAGDRVFTRGTVPLPHDLSASWFVQQEISAPSSSRNAFRLDLAVRWDVLKSLKRIGD